MSSTAASHRANQRSDTFRKGFHKLRNIFEKLKLCMNFPVSSIQRPEGSKRALAIKNSQVKLQCGQSESTFDDLLPSELPALKTHK